MLQEFLSPENLIAFFILIVWSLTWKLIALWRSSRNNQPVWFIFLFVVNTIGVLEILYLFIFSKQDN